MTENKIFVHLLLLLLTAYSGYTFLWSHFGLGVTSVIQLAMLVLIVIGTLSYCTSNRTNKNNWVNWLLAIWGTQAIAYMLDGSSSSTQFKEVTFVLMIAAPLVCFKYNPKFAKNCFLAMSLISISMYFVDLSIIRLEIENGYGVGYYSLVALPVFLYFFRNKTIYTQMIIVLAILVLVLMAMKRGDILACILSILVYYSIMLKHKGKFDFKIVLAFIALAGAGYIIFQYMAATNDIFTWRLEQTKEGNSSARNVIYFTIFNHFLNAPLIEQLFGGGFDNTVVIADARAHSDILEILSCEGLWGLLLLIGAFCSLFKQMIKCPNMEEKAILAIVLTIWFVKSFFSMFIFSQPSIILFALTGYILNKKNNKQYEY